MSTKAATFLRSEQEANRFDAPHKLSLGCFFLFISSYAGALRGIDTWQAMHTCCVALILVLLSQSDSWGYCDPFVVLKLNGQEHKSSIERNTLSPKWDFKILFSISDKSEDMVSTWFMLVALDHLSNVVLCLSKLPPTLQRPIVDIRDTSDRFHVVHWARWWSCGTGIIRGTNFWGTLR